jgi:hypothetical protein
MADIFMSYARPDRDKVRGLIPILEAQAWNVFWDSAIEPGRRWDELIAAELESARCIIVIWSQASVLSDWVKDEANRGRERQVLVPVSIDGTRAPLGFRHVQTESIDDWSAAVNDQALQRLLAGVQRIIGIRTEQDQTLQTQDPAHADQVLTPRRPDLTSVPGSFRFDAAPDGSFIVDYITECGDSFASTYAMAYLIATQAVEIGRSQSVPPGAILFLGINDPHPRPSFDHYERTFLTPYARAYSAQADEHRALFAVPAYHHSQVGLAHFETLFCAAQNRAARGRGLSFGGWDTHQHETFFAVALPHKWWMWGVDVRYGHPLASKQFNYFGLIAERMTSDDKIIICGPQENWLRSEFDDWAEQANLRKIVAIAEASGARVLAVITGGRREYAHSTIAGKAVELFEIGGGRHFVLSSHREPRVALLRWQVPGRNATDGNATSPTPTDAYAARPRDRSGYEKELDSWFLSKMGARSIVNFVRRGIANVIDWANKPPALIRAEISRSRTYSPGVTANASGFFRRRRDSIVLNLRTVLLPLVNIRYAFIVGCVYWLITWQFQNLVTQYNISGGKIDGLGITNGLWEVLPYMPLYLVSAIIASISLAVMLGGLYTVLLRYAGGGYAGVLHSFAKVFFGTAHFLAHVTAMFTLSLLVVAVNNQMAGPIEQQLDAMYRGRSEQAPIVRDVIQEGVGPLQREREKQQREQAFAQPGTPARPTPVRELVGFTVYPVLMIVLGGVAGGLIWGCYLAITGLFGAGFAEKAFAILRIKGYRSFLRLRLEPNQLTIYPVGLKRFPSKKRAWRKSREYKAATELVPDAPLAPELIEPPIVILANRPSTAP